jgi:hypothetical protein
VVIPFIIQAQTGPGGVGDASSNIFWLDATEISGFADGDDLDTWTDRSGNGLDLSQPNANLTPEYRTGVLNGHPIVRFNKTLGTYGRLRRTGLSTFPTTAITQFIVNANAGESNDAQTSYASSGGNNDFLIFNSSNLGIYRGPNTNSGVSANDGRWHIINPSWQSSDGDTRMWLDGTERFSTIHQAGTSITSNGCFAIAGEQDAIDGGYVASQAHLGDYAEVLVYNFKLNTAQRIIVNNYLAAKYDISLSGNDYFSYESTHGIDVAGIGRETATETHLSAMSDDLLQVSNPSGLANQEYLLFGHDGADAFTAWTSTEVPNGDNTIQRLAREWRFSETNGDVGDVDITIDVASLPALPAGFSRYGIMIDSDGDFNTGASIYELSFDSGTRYELLGLNIDDGAHLALCVIDPKIDFAASVSSGFEPIDASVVLQLNYISANDVSVDVSTNDGTALAGQPDYTSLSNMTVTIPAGSLTSTVTIAINDESVVESDETFTLSLSNPSPGVDVGSTALHTYTIHDDDNARKLYFSLGASSVDEGTATADIQVEMNSSSATAVSVDYAVIAGTATSGLGGDYILSAGTLSIPGGLGTTAGSITVNIIDNSIYESNETIIIRLSNPMGANLDAAPPAQVGTGIIEHTLTITDDDSPPSVGFSFSTSSGLESNASALMRIELDAISEVDVTVDYIVNDVTAISGLDYALADGSVTILAGDISVDLTASIINDALEELTETFTVTLSSANPASLGGATVFTYSITDDDRFGYTGPGGVGDSGNNILWLKADEAVYRDAGNTEAANGDPVMEWHDQSGNAHHLSQSNGTFRPSLLDNGLNSRPVMRFNVANNRLRRTSFADFPTTEITTIAVMNTAQSGDALVSYATPSDNNNYLIFNSGSQSTYIAGTSGNTGNNVADGNWHILHHAWTSLDGSNDMYEDGSSVFSGTLAAGRSITQDGCLAIGAEQDGVDSGYDANQDFDGDIAETIIYDVRLNAAQRIIVDNYLAAKYGLSINNDLYAYESGYSHEVAGLGRVDRDAFHLDAQGSAMLRIHEPRDLEDGEFMIWGHDNGLAQATEFGDVPTDVMARFERLWRASEVDMSLATANVGGVDIDWNLSGLGPVVESDLRLLVDTDNDGLFDDETSISGAVDMGSGIYRFEDVTAISNGTRFTLGSTNLGSTPLPIELLSFSATKAEGNKVRLHWSTASELNNDFFTVERSQQGSEWEELTKVYGAGNSSSIQRYQAVDYRALSGTSYYRLKQTDFDGTFSYSDPVSVSFDADQDVMIFPNPAKDWLNVEGSQSELEDIRIFNSLGQDLSGSILVKYESQERLRIDVAGLKVGLYLLQTKSGTHKFYKE